MKDTLGRNNRFLEDKECLHCKKTFRPVRITSKYCSRPCMWANNGKSNKRTGSSWINQKGYLEIRLWQDDQTSIRMTYHRYVMEKHLGRTLESWEDVHHIDGDKLNNNISNLMVVSHQEHTRITNSERKYVKGYKLNLTDQERKNRGDRIRKIRTAKAEGRS